MPVCPECGEDNLDDVDGQYYCATCHTQSQVLRDEESEAVPTIVRSLRKLQPSTDLPRTPGATGRPWEWVEAYQVILKHQAEALIELGVQEKVKEVIFNLWQLYLSATGVAFNTPEEADQLRVLLSEMNPIHRVNRRKESSEKVKKKGQKKVSLASAVDDILFEDSMGNEEFYEGDNPMVDKDRENTDGQSGMSPKDQRNQVDHLSLRVNVSICHLALLLCHNTVTSVDLYRWMIKKKFPYTDASILLPDDMQFTRPDIVKFSSVSVPLPSSIRQVTYRLIELLEITDFPQVDMKMLTMRYILELHLPAEMLALVQKFTSLEGAMLDINKRDGEKYKLPAVEQVAMAHVLHLLKLLFGLNGKTECEMNTYARKVNARFPKMNLFVLEDWILDMLQQQKEVKVDLPQNPREAVAVRDVDSCLTQYQADVRTVRFTPNRGRYDRFLREEVRDSLQQPFKMATRQLESGRRLMERKATAAQDPSDSDSDDGSMAAGEAAWSKCERHSHSSIAFITDRLPFQTLLMSQLREDEENSFSPPRPGCFQYYFSGSLQMEKWPRVYGRIQEICSHLIACEPHELDRWLQRLEYRMLQESGELPDKKKKARYLSYYSKRLFVEK